MKIGNPDNFLLFNFQKFRRPDYYWFFRQRGTPSFHTYSCLPNRRPGPNKHPGGTIHQKINKRPVPNT